MLKEKRQINPGIVSIAMLSLDAVQFYVIDDFE